MDRLGELATDERAFVRGRDGRLVDPVVDPHARRRQILGAERRAGREVLGGDHD